MSSFHKPSQSEGKYFFLQNKMMTGRKLEAPFLLCHAGFRLHSHGNPILSSLLLNENVSWVYCSSTPILQP